MNNYGKYIRYYRKKRGMTLKELSNDICSLTHIHRIEKGERKPSIKVLELFASKLGFSLFEFLVFNEYDLPDEASGIMKELIYMRRYNDFEGIIAIYEKYRNSNYMDSYPVGPAITMSYCHYLAYSDKPFVEVEALILSELRKSDINPLEFTKDTLADRVNINLLNILATLHKLKGDVEFAYKLLVCLQASLLRRRGHEYFGFLYVMVSHNLIHVKTLIEEKSSKENITDEWKNETYALLIDLIEFQKSFDLISSLPLTFIGLFNHFKESNPDEAINYLNKAEMLADVVDNKSFLRIIEMSREQNNLQ